jgi:hypothetical protein
MMLHWLQSRYVILPVTAATEHLFNWQQNHQQLQEVLSFNDKSLTLIVSLCSRFCSCLALDSASWLIAKSKP